MWFGSCICSGQSWNPGGIVCTAGALAEAAAPDDTAAAATMAATDSRAPPARTQLIVFLVINPTPLAARARAIARACRPRMA